MEQILRERELFPVKVTDKKEISPGVFLISWNRSESFMAGQVIKISLDKETPPRIYSICSGIYEKKNEYSF